MELDDLRRILELVREHELAEFELEQDGVRVHVVRPYGRAVTLEPLVQPSSTSAPTPVSVSAAVGPAPSEEEGVDLAVVKSPIVGTFYRSPEPGAAAFVEVGQTVAKRKVLCIIEAMKLMNEIESEYEGEIVRIYVENGQPVQYGERLFAIKVK